MNYLQKLINNGFLTQEEARLCMIQIAQNELSNEQIVAILTAIQMRGVQLSELTGFREALLEIMIPISLETDQSIDLCGTGGDGKNTFNISTISAFVLASLGYKVVKHGNHGVSSLCGSSTILEYLGYEFSTDPQRLQKQLDQNNICFLHAPLFHPALMRVAPLRKSLGIRTLFNCLGPLVNPYQTTHQVSGTYSLELAKQYQQVLKTRRTNFTVLRGLSGFDELTFIGSTRIFSSTSDLLIQDAPNKIQISLEALSAGDSVARSAHIFTSILMGKGSSCQNTVIAGNVALAIQTFQPEIAFELAFELAYEQILSGKAFYTFKNTCL